MRDSLAIIPVYLREQADLDVTVACLSSLVATAEDFNLDIMVIDDGSPDQGLVAELDEFVRRECAGELFYKSVNEGFSKTVNIGLRAARHAGRNALLINADMVFLKNNWWQAMQADPADVVGALLYFPNGLIQHAGIYYSVITRTWDHIFRYSPRTLELAQKRRICPVTGALQFIKFETLEKIGLYDENFSMGFEDVDYCIEVFRSGGTCAYNPEVAAVHYEGLFRRRDELGVSQKRWEESTAYLDNKHEGLDVGAFAPTMLLPEDY